MKDDVFVFAGPTITPKECKKYLDASYLPPAKHGDFIKLYFKHSPKIVLLIDGYFSNVPAIWHKEILFLLDQGVHIFGASSMGALRASELDVFGMRGVGEIYKAYSNGEINDDDEVTVTHASEKHNYKALSDAMVNIRATLSAALANNIISLEFHDTYIETAKSLFYKEREFEKINCIMENQYKNKNTFSKFCDCIARNKIDRKKLDAISALVEIKENKKYLVRRKHNSNFEMNFSTNIKHAVNEYRHKKQIF